jgi:tRNA 2-thiouridine synthesizing protein D
MPSQPLLFMSAYLLLVTASAQNSQSHLTAMKFAKQLIEQNIPIKAIFFYQAAVSVALNCQLPPSDEPQLGEGWSTLAQQHQLELQTCVAASLRRGVLGDEEAREQQFKTANLTPAFSMTGLGQLAAAISDPQVKLVHFK